MEQQQKKYKMKSVSAHMKKLKKEMCNVKLFVKATNNITID